MSARPCIERLSAVNEDLFEQACIAGWNEQRCKHDVNAVITSAHALIDGLAWHERYAVAACIYTARKKQLTNAIEAALMTPSYMGSKALHAVFQDWSRMLNGLPCLGSRLLKGEVRLVSNLCKRSKASIMPGDRLIYTAYTTLNQKEDYGTTFARLLGPRIAFERQREIDLLRCVNHDLEDLKDTSVLANQPLKERLEQERSALLGITGAEQWIAEMGELEELLRTRKPHQLSHKRKINKRLASLRERLSMLDDDTKYAIQQLDAALL